MWTVQACGFQFTCSRNRVWTGGVSIVSGRGGAQAAALLCCFSIQAKDEEQRGQEEEQIPRRETASYSSHEHIPDRNRTESPTSRLRHGSESRTESRGRDQRAPIINRCTTPPLRSKPAEERAALSVLKNEIYWVSSSRPRKQHTWIIYTTSQRTDIS